MNWKRYTLLMNRIYLDHAAATPINEEVRETIARHTQDTFGNPSSMHQEGVLASHVLETSRASVAAVLGVHTDEIIFTGSATESCNLAIMGVVRAWREAHPDQTPHIITSTIEHDAVLAAVRMLEKERVVTTFIPVDPTGQVDVAAIEAALTLDTVLVSIGYANNEIGVIQPISEIARLIRRWKKEVRKVARDVAPTTEDHYPLLHTDACQATNYLPLNMLQLGVDMMTINAAKIYGPKGVALLAKKRAIPLLPIVVGGGHERGMRAGTENVPLIAGFAIALTIAKEMQEGEVARLTEIQNEARTALLKIEGLVLNGVGEHNLPNIINFSLPNISHEFLAIALDAKGFAVSTKSACNEADAETSHVLAALRNAGHQSDTSGIRLSFGRTTTKEHIAALVSAIKEIQKNMIVAIV